MLTRVAREKALPFEPLVRERHHHRGNEARRVAWSFATVEDLMADLNADD
jgi:DNA-damage-inducible protein J